MERIWWGERDGNNLIQTARMCRRDWRDGHGYKTTVSGMVHIEVAYATRGHVYWLADS